MSTLIEAPGDTSVTVDAKTLAAAVGWAAKTVPNRPVIPTLGGMVVHATGDQLRLSGFDHDAHTAATVQADGTLDGRWLVSGRLFEAVVKTFGAKPVRVAGGDGKLVLRVGGSTITLPTMDLAEYPPVPAMPQPVGTVNAGLFAEAVARVAPATNPSAHPAWLTGMHIAVDGDRLTLSASDRYRAGVATIPWQPTAAVPEGGILVAADALGKLATALNGAGDTVTVSYGNGLFGLDGGDRYAVLRTLQIDNDAAYPNIAAMFGKFETTVVRVDVAGLKAAVERAALVLEPKTSIRLETDGGLLTVQGVGTGNVNEEVACRPTGVPLVINCNPTYLLTALNCVGAATVDLWFGKRHQPFSVTAADGEADGDDNYRHIIVPVRVAS